MKLIPTPNNTFILGENFQYKDVIIPYGFITNGADVPRIFWIFFPPFKPKYMRAVVVHDFLIKKGQIGKANQYFKELLIDAENTFVTRTAIKAVNLYWKFRKIEREKRVFND